MKHKKGTVSFPRLLDTPERGRRGLADVFPTVSCRTRKGEYGLEMRGIANVTGAGLDISRADADTLATLVGGSLCPMLWCIKLHTQAVNTSPPVLDESSLWDNWDNPSSNPTSDDWRRGGMPPALSAPIRLQTGRFQKVGGCPKRY